MKHLFLILITLSMAFAINATEHLVVDGTQLSTTTPFDNQGSTSQHIQFIYPRSLFTQTMGTHHHLAGLRFHSSTPIKLGGNFNITIRLKTTTSNSIIAMENFTTVVPVYSGSGEVADDQKSILFTFEKSRYFDLNVANNQNIIVDISVQGVSSARNAISWLGNTSSSSNRSITDNGTYSFTLSSFLPKTSFLVHKHHTVLYQGSTYEIYDDGMLSAVLSRFTCANSVGVSNFTYSPVRLNPDSSLLSSRTATLYDIPAAIPKTVAGTVNDVSVTAVGNNAFADLVLTEDIVIIFGGISQIGDNPWLPNNCFNSNCGTHTMSLIFCANLPSLVGSYFENIANPNVDIERIYYNDRSFDETWTDSVFARFGNRGFTSMPYQLTAYNIYGNLYYISPGSADFVSFDQLPYADRKLKVSFTDQPSMHNDGTNHLYDEMYDVSSTAPSIVRDITLSADGKSFTAFVNGNERFTITSRVHAFLKYGKGDPYLSTSQANIHLNGYDFLLNCDSLVFVYEGEDSVPYWEYVDDLLTDEPLYTSTDFIIHKNISSLRRSAFSFPFGINVDSLLVVNAATGRRMSVLTADYRNPYSSPDYDPTADYLLILRYEGYDSCTQVTTDTLTANRGYFYQVFPAQGSADTVIADVRFSSGKNRRPLYGSNHIQTITGLTFNGPAGNQGWSLVGNPNYCYAGCLPFGNYVTRLTPEGYSQHAFFDNIAVKPFEAVLYQTSQDHDSVGMDLYYIPSLFGDKSPNPYGNHSVLNAPYSSSLLSYGDFFERVALRMTAPDGTFDRTAVIDDRFSDRHFALPGDLSKLFNPWSQLYIHTDSVPAAFKSLDLRADSLITVPLGFVITATGSYHIALDSATSFQGNVYLLDTRTGRRIPLSHKGTDITFTAGIDTAGYALVLVPSDNPTGVENVSALVATLDAYIHDGILNVANIEEGSLISIYDISGRELCSTTAAGTFSYRLSSRGVYIVTLRGKTTVSAKVVY